MSSNVQTAWNNFLPSCAEEGELEQVEQGRIFAILKDKVRVTPATLAKDESDWNTILEEIGIIGQDRSQIKIGLRKLQDVTKYAQPVPLQSGPGAVWPFQPLSDRTQLEVKHALNLHFTAWKKKQTDKTLHALFLALWGPGRGKSRTLDEFPSMCRGLTEDNAELHERFKKNCFVFNVTFENGSNSISLEPGVDQVAVRMLYQLGKAGGLEFSAFKNLKTTASQVISDMLKGEGVSPHDATILLLVDSVQKLYAVDPAKLTELVQGLIDMVNSSPSFVVAACSGTFYTPFNDIIKLSHQHRVYLESVLLDGHKIIPINDPIVSVLVEDMGGHGRALSALETALKNIFSNKDLKQLTDQDLDTLENYDINKLLGDITTNLSILYPDVKITAPSLAPAVVCILTRRFVMMETRITNKYTCEDLVQLGLFSFSEDGHLNCPFVLLCILSDWSNDRTLAHLNLPSYNHIKADKNLPRAGSFWQDWEEFTAQFRVLKSKVFAGVDTTFQDLHAGAIIGAGRTLKVEVPPLDGYFGSKHHVPYEKGLAFCDAHPEKFIMNGTSAAAGDGFCLLKVSGQPVLEVHQNKHMLKTFSLSDWNEEIKKSANKNDFFIVFATHSSSIQEADLPERGAVVSQANYRAYFGPYAGRAFYTKRHINKASREELKLAPALGDTKADKILAAREEHGNFKGREDMMAKTGLKRTWSEIFIYD